MLLLLRVSMMRLHIDDFHISFVLVFLLILLRQYLVEHRGDDTGDKDYNQHSSA